MQLKVESIRAVAFDLDGTLIDTLPDLTAAVNAMLAGLGARSLPEARVRQLIGDGADQLVARALAESVGTCAPDDAQRAAAIDLFFRFYAEHLFVQSRVYPDAVATLRALDDASMSLCCITNKASRFALPLLELAGLRSFLDFTLCADRTEERKPSPVLLLEACRRLAIAPEAMLYVGDSHTDVMSARAAGCGTVTVTYGYHKPGALERHAPDATVTALLQIATNVLKLPHNTGGAAVHVARAEP